MRERVRVLYLLPEARVLVERTVGGLHAGYIVVHGLVHEENLEDDVSDEFAVVVAALARIHDHILHVALQVVQRVRNVAVLGELGTLGEVVAEAQFEVSHVLYWKHILAVCSIIQLRGL